MFRELHLQASPTHQKAGKNSSSTGRISLSCKNTMNWSSSLICTSISNPSGDEDNSVHEGSAVLCCQACWQILLLLLQLSNREKREEEGLKQLRSPTRRQALYFPFQQSFFRETWVYWDKKNIRGVKLLLGRLTAQQLGSSQIKEKLKSLWRQRKPEENKRWETVFSSLRKSLEK